MRDKYKIKNTSTIDKVKQIAVTMGWDREKDEKGRQFLADLKEAWTKYNNGANTAILNDAIDWIEYETLMPKEVIMFIHVREPESLKWFIEKFSCHNIPVCSLFVQRVGIKEFFNDADRNVENFEYDISLINQGSLRDLEIACKDLAMIIEHWEVDKKWIIT